MAYEFDPVNNDRTPPGSPGRRPARKTRLFTASRGLKPLLFTAPIWALCGVAEKQRDDDLNIEKLVLESRRSQAIPDRVEDPGTLARVAELLGQQAVWTDVAAGEAR